MSEVYDWNVLAEQAAKGGLSSIPGSTLRGAEAARAGTDALRAATGADTIGEAKRIALGRPRLDAEGEGSVTWKIRASTKLDSIVDEMAHREGLTRSALIREAVAEYARLHYSAGARD